ncbi:MRG-domain-containing protein [Vararia minispora EC-137]|uniref:MRG-domain-containing protein n=1 Tax=Vararia minispora EC-137 TaxID=1314806 RepID=A0ACB8R089_9AGAM|nr:MRG-domain-containing protein [Vararia minispora EC-137]
MSSFSPVYSVNEAVLCYHGPLIYEAKVLKVENWDENTTKLGSTGPHYFVHYKGWKQTWDEWVAPTRLLKINESNLALQKTLREAQLAANASSSSVPKASTAAKGAASAAARRKEGARGQKRGREEEDGARRPEMRLVVPDVLKMLLVDDWEAVTKNLQLVTLPRKPTVVDILQEFKTWVLNKPTPSNLRDPQVLLPTIISGLQLYFDRALGSSLLYRFERAKYAEIRKTYITAPTVTVGVEKEMSSIYGAEHLLRMIVNMPQMVGGSTMDPESVLLLKEYVTELMNFMVQEKDRLFQRQYDSSSLAYQNISRS